MSEQRERAAKLREISDAVRIEQNRIEEQRREKFLSGALFHEQALLSEGFVEGYSALIEEEFLRAKKGKTMLERLDLATDERFLGMVHVVELGVTTAPASDAELDGLKDEYTELRDFLVDKGLIKGEIPRQDSGRSLSVEPAPLTPEFVIVARNRPLVEGRADITLSDGTDVPVAIGIAKRMVFSMPSGLYDGIAKRFEDPGLKSKETVAFIEDLLERRTPAIGAIRTGYYLATKIAR